MDNNQPKNNDDLPKNNDDRQGNVTYSITFGNRAENHVGMNMIGQDIQHGFSLIELMHIPGAEIYDLSQLLFNTNTEPAYLIIIRNGISLFGIDKDEIFEEIDKQPVDKKILMNGSVVNKKARHNNIIGDTAISPNYSAGQGTVISFNSVPLINKVRVGLGQLLGPKAHNLVAETNKYYDVSRTYIKFHGDTERKIVICLRLGADFPLHYQWYLYGQKIGKLGTINLKSGDMYIMTEKAVGSDWKNPNICTLRHSAGHLNNIL